MGVSVRISKLEREDTALAHGGNRNQKLAARSARRKAVVTEKKQAERLESSLSGQIARAAGCPIVRCLRTETMSDAGIGHVILARQQPTGSLACGFFLVDLLCLGAKDVFYRDLSPSDFDDHIDRLTSSGQALVDMEPASAKTLIIGAVAFATASGIQPHKDCRTIVKLFGDVDGATASQDFAFGRDGMPVYVTGPHDSPTRIREITRRLDRACGKQGWDFPHPSENPTLQKIAALLQDQIPRDEHDDGLVIEHEGPAEPMDAE